MIIFEIKRFLKNRNTYISLLVGIILVLLQLIYKLISQNEMLRLLNQNYDKFKNDYYPLSVFNTYIGIDGGSVFTNILYTLFPLLIAIPYASSYAKDLKTGYIKTLLQKTNRKSYYISKYITMFLSGFIITLIILSASLILTSMFIPSIQPNLITANFPLINKNQLWFELYYSHPYIYLIFYILIDAFYYGVLSTTALTFSLFYGNPFISTLIPSIIYIFLQYIFGLFELNKFSPYLFLRADQPICADLNIIIAEFLVLLIVNSLIFIIRGIKKDVF